MPLKIVFPPLLQGIPIPERRWLLKDWMPEGTVAALYGDGGTGKSLLAQQLMTSCALGLPFLGLETKPCKVFGVFCEDSEDELHRRQFAILQNYSYNFADLSNMQYVSRVGEENLLIEFDSHGKAKITDFFNEISAAACETGAELIVIDTAADTFGGNENIRGQVRQYIATCLGRLAKDCNSTVIFCAHPSQAGLKSDEGSGGSTAWSNSVRSRLYLSRIKPDGDDPITPENDINNLRILTKKKANYSLIGDEITLEFKDGVFLRKYMSSSSIIDSLEAQSRLKAVEKAFLIALDNFDKQGRTLSAAPTAGNYAPKLMMTDPACKSFKKKEIWGAMNRLFNNNKIVVETYGKPSKQSKRIALVTEGVEPLVPAGDGIP